MNVLIVGSKRHLDKDKDQAARATFEKACRQMGRVLAEKGHTLIVGSSDEEDADRFFVEGANEVPGKHKTIVYRPDSDHGSTPFDAEREKFGNINLVYRARKGAWVVVHAHALREADVLIVMGGRTTTVAAGGVAVAQQKPVLALKSFDGGGEEVWTEVQRYYSAAGISEDDQGGLRENWTDDSARIAVKCAELLTKRNPLRPSDYGSQLGVLIATMLLIAGWVALFLGRPWELEKAISFYPMLIIAAMLGTSLRNTLRLVENPSSVSPRTLIYEATAGILIAFGFTLLYLIGDVVFNGKVIALTQPENSTRIAIVMSILGFGAAFLLNEAAASLRDRFVETLNKK